MEAPNDVWTADFKGQFRTRDSLACYPLTIVDAHSRFLIRCDGYASPDAAAKASFQSAFVEYGLPRVIRTDNGTPFVGARSPAGLSILSVWWVRLGIIPERIMPASPWENGIRCAEPTLRPVPDIASMRTCRSLSSRSQAVSTRGRGDRGRGTSAPLIARRAGAALTASSQQVGYGFGEAVTDTAATSPSGGGTSKAEIGVASSSARSRPRVARQYLGESSR